MSFVFYLVCPINVIISIFFSFVFILGGAKPEGPKLKAALSSSLFPLHLIHLHEPVPRPFSHACTSHTLHLHKPIPYLFQPFTNLPKHHDQSNVSPYLQIFCICTMLTSAPFTKPSITAYCPNPCHVPSPLACLL